MVRAEMPTTLHARARRAPLPRAPRWHRESAAMCWLRRGFGHTTASGRATDDRLRGTLHAATARDPGDRVDGPVTGPPRSTRWTRAAHSQPIAPHRCSLSGFYFDLVPDPRGGGTLANAGVAPSCFAKKRRGEVPGGSRWTLNGSLAGLLWTSIPARRSVPAGTPVPARRSVPAGTPGRGEIRPSWDFGARATFSPSWDSGSSDGCHSGRGHESIACATTADHLY